MGAALLAALIGATGCSKNEDGGDGGGNGGSGSNASKLESYAMTSEWINYATAVSSELLDDCIGLWAAWNGPTGIPDEDWERIGRDFFTKNTIVGANGYAEYMRTANAGNANSPAASMRSGRSSSTVSPTFRTKSAPRRSVIRTRWPKTAKRRKPCCRLNRGIAGTRLPTIRTTSSVSKTDTPAGSERSGTRLMRTAFRPMSRAGMPTWTHG